MIFGQEKSLAALDEENDPPLSLTNCPSIDFSIKDINLWRSGKEKTAQSLKDMLGLRELGKKYGTEKPLRGVRITGCVSVTYETANFVLLLKNLGADLRWCADNRFATRDDAAAWLAKSGIPVFAKSGESEDEFFDAMDRAVQFRDESGAHLPPDLIIDDGADITKHLFEKNPGVLKKVKAVFEQTTCGMAFFFNQEAEGKLCGPVIDINDSIVKCKFDNHFGIKESLISAIYNSGYMQIAGKNVVIAGYGEVGKGAAMALRGIGAKVFISEINPIALALAHMDGFGITTIDEACEFGDIFITATGCIKVVDRKHLDNMKDGALLVNIGHGNREIDLSGFHSDNTVEIKRIEEQMTEIRKADGKTLLVLSEGYLANMRAAKGNPPRVMSITFTNHILAIIEYIRNPMEHVESRVYQLSRETNESSIRLNFPEVAGKLTELTEEQRRYLGVANVRSVRACGN
jgi:adenosylhomocysteinase